MKKRKLVQILGLISVFVGRGFLPLPVFAQHGGHGGGGFHGGAGGFHGGGGGGFHGGAVGGFHGSMGPAYGRGHYGYSGGRYYGGGYRGGRYYGARSGYYGWHGGYHGWRGGYWGYPRYGYGWGFGFGFGWPWWGYPYAYGYSPWYAPYYSPYSYDDPGYCAPGNPCPNNGNDNPPSYKGNNDPDPPNSRPKPENYREDPGSRPAPGGTANTDDDTSNVSELRRGAPIVSVDRITATPANYRGVQPTSTAEQGPLRPELHRAMQQLREMPPFAREREIETGRYSHFSPKEKELLKHIE
jgi:hypothetical protein